MERLHPELVLLDVRMPGLDGVEVARRLRETHPETLLVLISADDLIDLPAAARMAGTVPFLRRARTSGRERSGGYGASTGADRVVPLRGRAGQTEHPVPTLNDEKPVRGLTGFSIAFEWLRSRWPRPRAAHRLRLETGPPWLEGVARALTVATPMAVGLFALHRAPFERFGKLLIAAGAMWFVTTLANASDPLPYSTGRVAAWLVEPLLVYLLLSFPTGRLTVRADRILAAGVALDALRPICRRRCWWRPTRSRSLGRVA